MKPFEYFRPTSVAQTVSLLAKHGEKAALLGGGTDLLGMMKDRLEGPALRVPQYVIAVKGIKELSYLRERGGALQIGAATTISEIASAAAVSKKHPLLAQAAGQVAVPQIRNVGTLAGNLCQRPRCWYFRGRLFNDCYRKGGSHCYAPDGQNQYHAVFGGDGCHMVYPSDLAPALVALRAKVQVAGPKGNRSVAAEQFYVRPGVNVAKENVLGPGEMVLGVEIPAPGAFTNGIYLKLKERQAFDFAIASVALAVSLRNDAIDDCRVVFGGVAPFPFRAAKVEAALKGKSLKGALAGGAKAVEEGAAPLGQNAYKVDAARGLLEKAVESLV